MAIDFKLPVSVYRVGQTCFSSNQVTSMVDRTNSKLATAGIEITIDSRANVPDDELAYVYQGIPNGYDNLVRLLTDNGSGPNKQLRVFLVKVDFDYRNDSWTYDPVADSADEDIWGGAIFITELYNENTDSVYRDLGYPPSSDSLLHEIGHVLMREANHYNGPQRNFFHEDALKLDDTIFPSQISKLRDLTAPGPSRYLVQA